MKKFMKYSLLLLLSSTLFIFEMHSVTKVVVPASSAAANNTTFGINGAVVQASAFYKPTGTMFFGLRGPASVDAVGYATRPAPDAVPTYTGIASAGAAASNSVIRGSNIFALDVVGDPTSDTTLRDLSKVKIVFLSNQSSTAGGSSATTGLTRAADTGAGVSLLTTTGGIAVFKSLTDGLAVAQTCYTMTLIAGNAQYVQDTPKSYVWAAVKATGAHNANRGHFGFDANDCIAAVKINNTDLSMTQVTPSTGGGDTRDLQISTVMTNTIAFGSTPSPNDTANMATPAMVYSQTLNKLYVGVNYTTGGQGNHAGGWGILIFRVHPESNGAYQLTAQQAQTTNLAANGNGDGGMYILTGSNIVGVGPGGTSAVGRRASLSYHNLGVMHTSVGPVGVTGTKNAYLIVNGGNGARADAAATIAPTTGATRVGNRVWAVPLVVNKKVGDVLQTNDIGLFANTRRPAFNEVAAKSGDLYTTQTAAVTVGAGPLPCPGTTAPDQMWVDGDAVYCSINGTKSNTLSPGVYCSQACFDSTGRIAHWTEWAKIAPNELGDAIDDGGVSRFAVDANTTRMWAVDGAQTSLRMSNWESSSLTPHATTPAADTTGLLYNLNTSTNLNDGCTAVCDLNSSTTAWGATTPMRIAMLGGMSGKVCFAVTGSGVYGSTQLGRSNPGDITTSNTGLHHQFTTAQADYSNSATLLKTTISGGKTVTCLAYSGWDSCTAASQTNGYFFAGTEEDGGLYVWTLPNLGAGFRTRNDITNLNSIPFRNADSQALGATASYRSWQKLDRISGTPVKIQARGGAIYILTRVGGATPLDRIYRITRQNLASSLNTDFVVTASSGVGSLASVGRIVDFVITSSGATATTNEQLAMLTDDGIYATRAPNGTNTATNFTPALAQTTCDWSQVAGTDATVQFFYNQPAYTRDPQTLWYSKFEQNNNEADIYNKTSFVQRSRLETGITSAVNPAFFNAFDDTATDDADFIENDITTNFYSDGNRRIFQRLSGSSYKLASRPFEVAARWWDMTANNTNLGSAVKGSTYVHWVSLLGDTGKLCAGTNKGVIGLI